MKKTVALVLSFIFIMISIPFAFTVTAGASRRKGDVDFNGFVESKDYLMIKCAVLNTYALSEDERAGADVSGDGDVTAVDYLMVKRDVLKSYFIDSYVEYSEGLEYWLTNGGQSYRVLGIGSCSDADIAIPPVHDGLPVTAVGSTVFTNNGRINSIYIPASVTNIYDSFVHGCSNLVRLTVSPKNPVYHSAGNCIIKTEEKKVIAGCKTSVIPDDGSVTVIGEEAFYGCSGLESIVIPEGVTAIEESAFDEAFHLESISFPESLKYIGKSAFYNCFYLNVDLVIPDNVEYIGAKAFYCTTVKSVSIGKGLNNYEAGAFSECREIVSITVDEDNETFYSVGNCIVRSADGVLVQGSSASVIPEDGSIREIGDYAFCGMALAENLKIPDSVEKIGECAFKSIDGTKNVLLGAGVKTLGDYAFHLSYIIESITLNEGLLSIGENALSQIHGMSSITIPSTVNHIGLRAFQSDIALNSVTFANPAKWKLTNYFDTNNVVYLSPSQISDRAFCAQALLENYVNYVWDKA